MTSKMENPLWKKLQNDPALLKQFTQCHGSVPEKTSTNEAISMLSGNGFNKIDNSSDQNTESSNSKNNNNNHGVNDPYNNDYQNTSQSFSPGVHKENNGVMNNLAGIILFIKIRCVW